jgi:hypothetical protein
MHHDIMFNIETKKAVVNSKKPRSMQMQGKSECEKSIQTTAKKQKVRGRKETKPLQTSAPHALLPQRQ